MDGVIYHGNQILPGVPEFIQWLHDEKKEYLFLTNNSGYTPRELNQKLARMGLDVPEEHFYTSALATAAFLKEQAAGCSAFVIWSYVKKKYKLNVTNFLCSERSLTCYFYCILLDVFKILFLIFIWRQISTMTVNAHGIVKCFDVFKNQFMCMCIIKDFKPVDPFSLQKCMERFNTGIIPWICFL